MKFRILAIATLTLLIAGFIQTANATDLDVTGGSGDAAKRYLCAPGQVLVGFFGRAGLWTDQLGLVCAPVATAFALGGEVMFPPVGGLGGAPSRATCAANSAIRGIRRRWYADYSALTQFRMKYIRSMAFACYRPQDGSYAGQGEFGGTGRDVEGSLHANGAYGFNSFDEYQDCPGNEYAVGLNIRYGTHVNAVGLICSIIVAPPTPQPAPPPPATPNSRIIGTGLLPKTKMNGPNSAPVPSPPPTQPNSGPLPSPPMQSTLEMDSDRPGADYNVVPLATPQECRASCQASSGQCKAWTWVKPGVQVPQALCYMKGAVPPATSNACCVSGVVDGQTGSSGSMMEPDTDRPGSDYGVLLQKSPKSCQAACQATQGECKAWTWVKTSVPFLGGRCFLKSTVPQPKPDSCCVSGRED